MQRSSAYNKWCLSLPPSKPHIVDVFKISLKPSMYTLKSCGDKTPPCRKPLKHIETIRNVMPPLGVGTSSSTYTEVERFSKYSMNSVNT